MYRVVAAMTAFVHVVFVGFTVLGGFLAWAAPWVLVPHLISAAWGACILRFRRACPLSVVENWARAAAGRPQLHERGFIAHYFEERVYPIAWAPRVELGACALVFASWLGLAVL